MQFGDGEGVRVQGSNNGGEEEEGSSRRTGGWCGGAGYGDGWCAAAVLEMVMDGAMIRGGDAALVAAGGGDGVVAGWTALGAGGAPSTPAWPWRRPEVEKKG